MATPYEWARVLASPVFPAHGGRVRRDVKRLLAGHEGSGGSSLAQLLDIGGRRSPYTAGLDARVTILDIPPQGEVQKQLHLGVDDEAIQRIGKRRSNIEAVVLEDMCHCTLADDSFDGLLAVEVIEHVEDDESFVEQSARVLRSSGWAYFTTPNGDYVKNEPPTYNPDHVRHYTRQQLTALLQRHFDEVHVVYGIKTGIHRYRGLRRFDIRQPLQLASTLMSNLLSRLESRGLDETSQRTAHLFAIARKTSAG